MTVPLPSPRTAWRWLQGASGEGYAHRRVRLAMYGVLVLLASLALLRTVRLTEADAARQIDIQIMEAAAAQSVLVQGVGNQSVLLALIPPSEPSRPERVAQQSRVLSESLALTRLQADVLENLLETQADQGWRDQPEVRARLTEWRTSRQVVWDLGYGVLAQAKVPRAPYLAQATAELQKAVAPALQASTNLVSTVREFTRQRDAALLLRTRWLTGLALVLFILLAVFVVEPTARAVRRQYRALHAQTARLTRLAMVAELSSNAIAITNPQHRVEWVNAAFVELTGLSAERASGRRIGTLLKARSADPAHFSEINRALRRGEGIKREIRLFARNAEIGWALVDMQPIHAPEGGLTGWVLVATDMTEVRAQQQLLSLAVDGAGLGIWHWDILADVIDCNDRLLAVIGHAPGELDMRGTTWFKQIHPDDQGHWRDALRDHLRDAQVPMRVAVRTRHSTGRWVWVMFAGTVTDRGAQGQALRLAGVAMDVNSQKAMEQQLRTAARTDVLTQLPNRTVVVDMIRTAIARQQAQPGYHFAVLFMDFDRFKQVNDTLGHTAGDDLLRQIARRLEDSLRPGDSFVHTSDFAQMAARIGGDEFVVLLDDIRGDLDAEIVAGRLLDVLAAPYHLDGHRISSTASIGIVTSTHAGADPDSVLRDADIAMYEAKRSGRARYAMFDPDMRQRVNTAVSLENDLRQALGLGQMSVVYQPLVRLEGGAMAGMEALVRWTHPERGPVSPVEFIPVAEACGLIDALGQFVLQQACAAFAQAQQALGAKAPPSVAVNLSRAQLVQPRLVADILEAVRTHGMAPHQLVLEVTESLAAQDAQVQQTLGEIRALGVGLALDDFGTGYSSLSCLHELPVNTVKIDRSFVSQAAHSEYHRVLIDATLRMARALGLDTVAEGIETAEQAELMRAMGCERGQGFWFSRPLELTALFGWAKDVPQAPI
jgi:diguanylate cyclase (GGDEF)-like protein/PAS domain S-box-containing protein